jgi:hypothetical protein
LWYESTIGWATLKWVVLSKGLAFHRYLAQGRVEAVNVEMGDERWLQDGAARSILWKYTEWIIQTAVDSKRRNWKTESEDRASQHK